MLLEQDAELMAEADARMKKLRLRKQILYDGFYPNGGREFRLHSAIVDALGELGHMSVGLPVLTNLMAEFGALKVSADSFAHSQIRRAAGENAGPEDGLETTEEIVERVCAELCEQVTTTFLEACTTLGLLR